MELTQDRINQLADAAADHQFIHIDIKKAKQTPYPYPLLSG